MRTTMKMLTVLRATAGGGVAWWLEGGIDPSTVVAVYQPLGASSLAESYLDLSGNGHHITLGVAPTFDSAVGWTFNGTSQYLLTDIVPPNNQTWSMVVRYSIASLSGFRCVAGCSWAAGNLGFQLSFNGTTERRYYNGGLRSVAGSGVGAHVMSFRQTQGYFDGVAEGAAIPTAAGTNTYPIAIGALNNQGNRSGYFPGIVQAVAVYKG
jgi:hypothetical protein